MRRRTTRNQWLVISLLVTLSFYGSFLFRRHQQPKIYYESTTRTTTVQQTTPATSFSLAPVRHVTKSLAELGKMDEINAHVLFLNQIPKCGAEVLILLLQKMQGFNSYRHVRLKSEDGPKLSRLKEEELVDAVYDTMRSAAVPLSFDRHVRFINFTTFDKQSPTFVNLIREPADKLLSRSGRDRDRVVDLEEGAFLECLSGESDCYVDKIKEHDLSVAYFCGHDARCGTVNSQWALETAKTNVEKYYPVVGVLEELNATLEVLESHIPYFFKGVQTMYNQLNIDKYTKKKNKASSKARDKVKRVLTTEYEFYDWIKTRLFQQLQVLYGDHSH